MPGPYGVTPTGFNRKTVRDILSDIETSQRAEISTALNLSSSTPWGQNNGIFSNELGIAWEVLEICYHAFDPDAAEDFLLTSLSKLTGTERRAASYSLVTLACDLDAGTDLISGTNFAAVDGDSTSLWTPVEDYEAATGGTQDVLFRAENPGAVSAAAGTITVIHTSVAGWNSVTNALDASEGHPVDSDGTLRSRREEQLTATGSSTTDAIESDVLELDGVDTCRVFENETGATVDGVPPYSIEAVVFDGETPSVDNDDIAQAILSSKAGGVRTYGATSGTAVDQNAQSRTVYFSRPTQIPIYISLTVVEGASYDEAGGATALKAFLVEQLKSIHGVGKTVQYRLADSLALYWGGLHTNVSGVTAFTIGTSPSPTGTGDIAITSRQLATFDTSRVTVS